MEHFLQLRQRFSFGPEQPSHLTSSLDTPCSFAVVSKNSPPSLNAR